MEFTPLEQREAISELAIANLSPGVKLAPPSTRFDHLSQINDLYEAIFDEEEEDLEPLTNLFAPSSDLSASPSAPSSDLSGPSGPSADLSGPSADLSDPSGPSADPSADSEDGWFTADYEEPLVFQNFL